MFPELIVPCYCSHTTSKVIHNAINLYVSTDSSEMLKYYIKKRSCEYLYDVHEPASYETGSINNGATNIHVYVVQVFNRQKLKVKR